MGFGAIDGSDAGLLQIISQTRNNCDELARMIAEHSSLHTDHGSVDCDSIGPFYIAQLLIGQGSALAASGANLLESLIADMAHTHDDDEEGN